MVESTFFIFCYFLLFVWQTHKGLEQPLGASLGIKGARRDHPGHRISWFLEHPPTKRFSQHHTHRRATNSSLGVYKIH